MTSPLLCKVWTSPLTHTRREREGDFHVVEVDFPDLESVLAHLSAGRILTVRIISSRRTARGDTRVITGRRTAGLTAAGIASIAEWYGTLVEEAAGESESAESRPDGVEAGALNLSADERK